MSKLLRLAVVAALLGVAVSNNASAASKPSAAQSATPAASQVVPAKPEAGARSGKSDAITQEQALALAKKGNCLVCHKIDSKLVGPAWKNVGAKYKGKANAASTIAANIKSGGSFGWKIGSMPPRGGSKISDADVESLAKFIASLK